MRRQRCLAMFFDVLACELIPVWAFTQANLLSFSLGVFDLPSVAQYSPDHPKRSDANGRGAMNKRRTIVGLVSDLQKLRDLFLVWITEGHRDIEIAQPQ